jgi:hypothetical protein
VHIRTSIAQSRSQHSRSARATSTTSRASTPTKLTQASGTRPRTCSHPAAPRWALRPRSTTRAPFSANCAADSRPTPAVPPNRTPPLSGRDTGFTPCSARLSRPPRATEVAPLHAIQRVFLG